MAKHRYRTQWIAGTLAVALITIMTPTATASAEDECAGGVDASDDWGNPTPLEDEYLMGCGGGLYKPPGNSTSHGESDTQDIYSLRMDGVGTAKIHFQLCNGGAGLLFIDIWYKQDLLPSKRMVSFYMEPGQCTSAEPVEIVGQDKPGTWKFEIWTMEDELANGKTAPYDLYVNPLWK